MTKTRRLQPFKRRRLLSRIIVLEPLVPVFLPASLCNLFLKALTGHPVFGAPSCNVFTMFSATHLLCPQRRAELRSAFDFFDKKGTGLLDLNTFVFLLKSIGANISRKDLKAITSEYEERKDFSFEDLLLVAHVVYNDVAIERGLLQALREIAPPRAVGLPLPVLREYLLKLGMGIKLTEEEVDFFLRVSCDPDGTNFIDFETFISRVLRD